MIKDLATCLENFAADGYAIVRGLLDPDETKIVSTALTTDPALRQHMFSPRDADGKGTDIVAWNHPGDSSYGLLARSEPIIAAMRLLLGGEVYHYHSKVTAKAAMTGGAWEWHQDYDYWRTFGCPEPLLVSIMIAVDDADHENGCLQIISGSHKNGLLPHRQSGTQRGIDDELAESALAAGEHKYCELDAGDAVIFHCNTLHRSDANNSSRRRWSLLCCYNAARNSPENSQLHPGYTPLQTVPAGEIVRAGVRMADGQTEGFLEMN